MFAYTIADQIVYLPDGGMVTLHRGEVWNAEDPFVVERPHLFSSTPIIIRNTLGATTPDPSPLGVAKPRKVANPKRSAK